MTVTVQDAPTSTAAQEVEFISAINARESSELFPKPGRGLDPAYLRKYARSLEDFGFDYTLVAYNSDRFDPFTVSAALTQYTDRLKPIVALRPNIMHPTVAAQALASLDQLSRGRAVVHIISGGSAEEQARQGDFTTKEERYRRSEEYIGLLRRAWTEPQAFSHSGEFYRFTDFGPGFPPYGDTVPISLGGSSADAYRVGGALADIYGLWGEPLADTQIQIDRIAEGAKAAGRVGLPRIWVTFRPIVAATDAQAWEKAEHTLERIDATYRSGTYVRRKLSDPGRPQNVGSQRLLEIAARDDRHDRALWTRPAQVTNAQGASTALVGSYETVAAAILDYVDLGATLVSIRGYDNLNDAIDYGRFVIPLVREELAHRRATGLASSFQDDHPGLLAAGTNR